MAGRYTLIALGGRGVVVTDHTCTHYGRHPCGRSLYTYTVGGEGCGSDRPYLHTLRAARVAACYILIALGGRGVIVTPSGRLLYTYSVGGEGCDSHTRVLKWLCLHVRLVCKCDLAAGQKVMRQAIYQLVGNIYKV